MAISALISMASTTLSSDKLSQSSTAQVQTAAEQGSALTTMSNMLGGLIIVLALIFLLAYLLRRLKLVQNNHSVIKTLAVTPLGPKEKLVLAQVGEQQYLLGVTAQQVNLIDKLDTPVNVEPGAFASRLQQARAQQAGSQQDRDMRTRSEPTLTPSEDKAEQVRGTENKS